MMYAMHAAPRRELERIALVTARPEDDPKHVQRTAAGWEMLQSYLQVHYTTEDDMLWPPMRKPLADDSHGVALLDALAALATVVATEQVNGALGCAGAPLFCL